MTSRLPQARVVALAECGTHAVFAAEIGKYSESEATLTSPLLDRLESGMLLTADRGFFSYAFVAQGERDRWTRRGVHGQARSQRQHPAGPPLR